MSLRALGELARDLEERLGEWLGIVADRYGVPLPLTPFVHQWHEVATDEPPKGYPYVHVRHAGARLGIQKAHQGVHDSMHSVVIEFEQLSEDRASVAACMTYAPEAFLRWLDTYPLGSRSLGGMIQKIAPPDGQNIRLQGDEVMARQVPQPGQPTVVQYRWGMSLAFDIEVRDTSWSTES